MGIIEIGVDELAAQVSFIDSLEGIDRHNAMYSFSLKIDQDELLRVDPFSDQYANLVLDIYKSIYYGDYSTDSESDVVPYDALNPAPFSSRNASVVGDHFGSIATLLRDFPVNPPARVLDVGVGWGHTSLILARTGFDVDAVDINAGYLALVNQWAERMGVNDRLRTLELRFDQIGELSERYDAILFFESFHHALHHGQLIADCARLLTDTGSIVFAGEPIFAHWPVPWGMRPESLAAYCIHKFGWLELGFNETYFLEMLVRNGLYGKRRRYTEFPTANGYVARRLIGRVPAGDISLPLVHEARWLDGGAARWSNGASTLPGWLLKPGVQIEISNYRGRSITGGLFRGEVCQTAFNLAPGETATLPVVADGSDLEIRSERWSPAEHGSVDDRELGVAIGALIYN